MKCPIILMGTAALILTGCSSDKGDVKIQLPSDYKENTIVVTHITLDNIFSAKKQEDLKIISDTLEVKNGEALLNLDRSGAAWYSITPTEMTRAVPEFYATPGDHLEVKIKDFDPLSYTVTGSELMEDLTSLNAVTTPIQMEYMDLVSSSDSVPADKAKAMMDKYDAAIKKFVTDHPKSPAIPFVILELSGDDFKAIYDNLTPEARKSILMPYADQYNQQVEEMLKERKAENDRKAEVASGTITAPNFTLPDLSGKKVSLSDFRGKWVVLDFWGSWCGWCVKGFPALKKAYNDYGDKIVVIGIDCNESEKDWKQGLEKYELPWINLYNGHDKKIYSDYKIEGFPTKAIINPEGKLVDLTTGEDPEFFTRLASFVE